MTEQFGCVCNTAVPIIQLASVYHLCAENLMVMYFCHKIVTLFFVTAMFIDIMYTKYED